MIVNDAKGRVMKIMKRILIICILSLIFWGFYGKAWSASGFEVVGRYNGDTWGILFYIDDSIFWLDDEDIDSSWFLSLRDYGFDIYSYRPMSTEEVLKIAIDVMTNGPQTKGWDYCAGLVYYYQQGYLYWDIYILGYNGTPYIHVGQQSIYMGL